MPDELTVPGLLSEEPSPDAEAISSLLSHIPAVAYVCDAQSRVRAFNEAASRFWGRTPAAAECIRQLYSGFRLYDADGQPIVIDETVLARPPDSGDRTENAKLTIERADGARTTFLVQVRPLQLDSPREMGATHVLEELALQRDPIDAERFLATIVASSDDAIVSKDLNGRIQSWNAGAEQLFGYSADEAIGQPITIIIPPDLLDEERSILQRLRQGQHIAHYETWRVDKGGRRKPISLSVSPIKDATGAIVGAAKVARDISAQKAAEAELLELQQVQSLQLADLLRLQQMSLKFSATLDVEPILQETLQTACALSDTKLGVISLHDAQSERLSIGASLGFDERFLRALESQAAGVGAWGRCLREKCRVIVEDVAADASFDSVREFVTESGVRGMHSVPLIARTGRLIGVLSLAFSNSRRPSDREIRLLDICARQAVDCIENARLYQELREADRRKDEFLAMLAHELRNPLAPLTNSLEIMRLSKDGGSTIQGLRAIMETQVQHLVRLVDDLLDVSRITRGKIELRPEPVSLSRVVETAVAASRPHLDAAEHQFELELPQEPIRLRADPVRIAQVISNLLNNSCKFTPSPGHIRLSIGTESEQAVIRVEDNGQGIASDALPQIFEMFSQLENVRAQSNGGLGLGLAVSRALVELHGGTIEAASDGPGCGTCFTVRLPIDAAATARLEDAGPETEIDSLARRRIVVVDDTRVAAHVLGRLLESLGQDVSVAYDARSALELVRSERPHVLVSDIAMPDMDGYELARRIRASGDHMGITLVALTGYGQDSDRQRAYAAGFDFHLVKPVGIAALRELLNGLPHGGD